MYEINKGYSFNQALDLSLRLTVQCMIDSFYVCAVPMETLTREAPEKLDKIENSLFTCYAVSSTEMPLPTGLSLKLTANQNDYLTELLGSGSIELEAETTTDEFENTEGLLEDRASR